MLGSANLTLDLVAASSKKKEADGQMHLARLQVALSLILALQSQK